MSELLEFLGTAEQAAERAVEVIRSGLGRERSISGKGDRDFATDLDFAVEDAVRAFLAEATPGVPLLGEERGRTGDTDSPYEWVLDPIDGTINFAHRSPQFGVSLALTRNGMPVVGVVHAPMAEERYSAALGHGAALNKQSLSAVAPEALAGAVVAMGDFAVGPDADRRNLRRLATLQRLVPKIQRIRMLGSAALDLCWLAAGRHDAVMHDRINLWDVAAGTVICREAGVLVTDFDGVDYGDGAVSILAATPRVHRALLAELA
ncbi:inositol monophosphatase [Glycomyces sp. TRM65418]|uniref:inositol monophosphatase family protein n=1 Tax=Glycomyces sp. TRM65418 TaxID=2867006 RepID=UPI001CE53017|nr:inositol monophosphatase family protein [Glycomyces sp. TRM65418]MCC3761629.1 inositol monophosphatase [Glycomyces sp. TRM65418]QZD55724.1 inositol monophosphatase [Glycomyces sp. TRM65418]